jgi:hypothetical protein
MAQTRCVLPRPGQAEGEQILAPLDEAPLAESGQLLLHLGRHLGAIEGGEGLLARQLGELLMALDAATTALLDFELGQMVQVLAEGPPLALGLLGHLLAVARERRELERAKENRERLCEGGSGRRQARGGHVPTFANRVSSAKSAS